MITLNDIKATFGDEGVPVIAVPAGTQCKIIEDRGDTVIIETEFGYYETTKSNLQ